MAQPTDLFGADGTPLHEDNVYQDILSKHMDQICDFEDRYRQMGTQWNLTDVRVRDGAPELDPATNLGARYARDFFDVRDEHAPVRDVGHEIEALIADARSRIRRGHYRFVKMLLDEIDWCMADLKRRLDLADDATQEADRLHMERVATVAIRGAQGIQFSAREAGLRRWDRTLPAVPVTGTFMAPLSNFGVASLFLPAEAAEEMSFAEHIFISRYFGDPEAPGLPRGYEANPSLFEQRNDVIWASNPDLRDLP
ncbi:uncharacterized protein BKCO1_820005 [Diplodia corticola]|uniref:Uncharacterized protein n=1 Tax=Diplodia corticola TaxID=236234 RepID=A0A1J9QLP8_9PEZI|nr:uncharacterized protein BKCO1_820005 [Diplodia corticola]OJD29385.1 hypothetical protein BKCO1_820005 [Diplodia corticola]